MSDDEDNQPADMEEDVGRDAGGGAGTFFSPTQDLVGSKTRHIQLMKASFFANKEDNILNQTYTLENSPHLPTAASPTPATALNRLEEHQLMRSPSSRQSPATAPVPPALRGVLHTTSLHSSYSIAPSPVATHSHTATTAPSSHSPALLSTWLPGSPHLHHQHQQHRPTPPPPALLQAQSAVLMVKRDLQVILPPDKDTTAFFLDRKYLTSDLGLSLGRSFRVGWGPNWTLTHSGQQLSKVTRGTGGLFAGPVVPTRTVQGEGHLIGVVVEQASTSSQSNDVSHRYDIIVLVK